MLGKKVYKLRIFLAVSFILSVFSLQSIGAPDGGPKLSLINPGPTTKPSKWTAGPARNLGTSNFLFYSNETRVNDTFFMNITIENVENMRGWEIGIIYDARVLAYADAWHPSDHVFKPVEDMGWSLLVPQVTAQAFNSTHSILKWGCTYIMGDTPWTFNGSGKLCQMQFKIIKPPLAEASFGGDPDWTQLYFYPGGVVALALEPAYFAYFSTDSQQTESFPIWIVAAIVTIVAFGAALLVYFVKARKK